MTIDKRMEAALNEQIKWELYSSYLYLSMSSWYESAGLKGFANWEFIQAQEEKDHAMKIFRYVISRGGRVILHPIDAPPSEWASPLDAFQVSLEHEQKVTSMINNLVDLSIDLKDHATHNMLQWFVDEQIEEEEDAGEIVDKLRMIEEGGGKQMLFMLDKELGTRVYTPLQPGMAPGQQ
ncbi:MAG: ferritin [Methanomicrobiaceae archaeon]|nr:ferritin [Methanomicrobiaceae archaeon]